MCPKAGLELPGSWIIDLYLRWPSSMVDAMRRAEGLRIPSSIKTKAGVVRYEEPSLLAVSGMGGSAIGGDLLSDLLVDQVEVPIITCRGYHLPSYVREGALVFTISYSGNTEETLSTFLEALKRKCMVIAITSGGRLAYLCRKLKVPILDVPEGMVPRAALPYLFIPLIILAERFNVAKGLREQVKAAASLLMAMRDELGPDVPEEENRAKELASRIMGTVPVVYGFGHLRAVAYRLKTQFNENSKVPSFYNCIPDLNHDEIVGWEGEEALTKGFSVIFLRSPREGPEVKARIELTKQIIAGKVARILEIRARGSSRLEEMFSVLYVGEVASLYLALMRGVDPSVTPSIDMVKHGMEKLKLASRIEERALSLMP